MCRKVQSRGHLEMWGEQAARAYLEDAGFEVLTVARPPADPINSYFTCRRATAPA